MKERRELRKKKIRKNLEALIPLKKVTSNNRKEEESKEP